ncbi:MAG: hypothetical protein ACLSAP_02825 [Oscillospiraceae bacterium]
MVGLHEWPLCDVSYKIVALGAKTSRFHFLFTPKIDRPPVQMDEEQRNRSIALLSRAVEQLNGPNVQIWIDADSLFTSKTALPSADFSPSKTLGRTFWTICRAKPQTRRGSSTST